MIRKETRDKIVAQALSEISAAREHRRKRISDWHKNEDILSDSIASSNRDDTRNMPSLNKAHGFVETILSKIDNEPVFKYLAQNPADRTSAKLLNALRETDAERDNWVFKDLLSKKQAITYGRTISHYFAEGNKDEKYKPNNTLIDIYDFLIDPNCGGLDINEARYLGHYGVKLDEIELQAGMRSGKYLKTETKQMLSSDSGNSNEKTTEEDDKENRKALETGSTNAGNEIVEGLYEFWNWYTMYNGKKYYLVLSETHASAIRVEEYTDITDSDLWPYFSWAVFPSLTEFWSKSYIDVARDIFKTQNVSIYQMMRNAEKINDPQRAVDVKALVSPADLKYKRGGTIRMKDGTNINQALQIIETPSIDTPITVYDTLDTILQLMTGVTSGVQGVAEEETLGIYEGNIANTTDRFNLLNKSYANGYKQFGHLYKWGVQEHLIDQDVAVSLIGASGIEVVYKVDAEKVNPFADYLVSTSSSAAENMSDKATKREKVASIDKFMGTGLINEENAVSLQLEIMGFEEHEIKKLTETSNTLSNKMMEELYRDIENILAGKDVQPNMKANLAYSELLLDYILEHQENLEKKDFIALMEYMQSIKSTVNRNEVMALQADAAEEGLARQLGQGSEEEELLPDEIAQTQPEEQLQGDLAQEEFGGDEQLII